MSTTERAALSFWPKEHGAYAQLGLPLVSAVAMGHPSIATLCLVVAASALFVAHEPLLIALGARGVRVQRAYGPSARRVATMWGTFAVAAAAVGLVRGGSPVMTAATLPILWLLVLVPFVVRGIEKTLAGELVVAFALTAAAAPVTVAAQIPLETAATVWMTWALAFATSTSAVRWVIAAHRGRRDVAGLIVACLASAAVLSLAFGFPESFAALPILVVAWLLIARPAHPRHLRRVGWALFGAGLLTAIVLVTLVRSSVS